MGNSSSSASHRHQDDTVDFGFLTPQGVYTGPRDWNQAIVSQLICARKLAPFYRPLEDYEEDWDDDTILAHRKQPPQNADMLSDANTAFRVESSTSSSSLRSSKRPPLTKESAKNEAAIYRGAVECPICFLVCAVHPVADHPPLITLRQSSITLQISTILAAVTRLSAQSASYKSSERNRLRPMSFLNQPPAHIAFRRTSASYTLPLHGALV